MYQVADSRTRKSSKEGTPHSSSAADGSSPTCGCQQSPPVRHLPLPPKDRVQHKKRIVAAASMEQLKYAPLIRDLNQKCTAANSLHHPQQQGKHQRDSVEHRCRSIGLSSQNGSQLAQEFCQQSNSGALREVPRGTFTQLRLNSITAGYTHLPHV